MAQKSPKPWTVRGGVDKAAKSRYNKYRKGRCDKRLAQYQEIKKTLKPSLGRVAVSAFYDNRYRERPDM